MTFEPTEKIDTPTDARLTMLRERLNASMVRVRERAADAGFSVQSQHSGRAI